MRPIILKGHERPITGIKFNREGDLLFSSSKGYNIVAWYSENGERLGTYDGHGGAVWSVDVSRKTEKLISGSADQSVRIWDVENGKELQKFIHKVSVRQVAFSYADRQFYSITDAIMNQKSAIQVWDLLSKPIKPIIEMNLKTEAKIQSAMWGPLNETILTAGEDGVVRVFDVRNGKEINAIKEHTKAVTHITPSKDGLLFATSSKDGTSRLYDMHSYQHLKTYHTGRPINSCSLSPIKEEILVGGGQEASQVTTTRVDAAQFKVRFFHLIHEEDIGGLAGHFGPVNVVIYKPDGSGFATGGEDGYIRLQTFDSDYYTRFGVDN